MVALWPSGQAPPSQKVTPDAKIARSNSVVSDSSTAFESAAASSAMGDGHVIPKNLVDQFENAANPDGSEGAIINISTMIASML